MNTITISMVILIILVVAFIGVGIWFKRMATTADDFLLAGRGAPFWILASAYLGGYVGGASVSGYVNLGYSTGISGMWTSVFVITGCIIFIIIFSRRLNYFGRKTGAVTLADFVCERYGEKLRLPVAIFGFFRPGFLTGMQFLAIAVIANIVFGLDIKIGVVLSAVIILLYLITAGQYSALITQWFQSVIQSLGILLFAIAAFKMIGDPVTVTKSMFELIPESFMNFWAVNPAQFCVWLLTFCIFYLVDPWIYMWAYVGKSPRVSSNGMLAVLGGSYYNVLPFLAGMAILVGTLTGKIAIPEGLSSDGIYAWFTIEFMSTAVGVVVLVGLLMTVISCGSSFAMNGVTILTRDIYQKCINKNSTDKQALFASRMSLIVVVIIGIASALWLPDLVPLWSLAQALGISGLLATTLCAWFWRRSTTAGALSSTLLGGGTAFVFAVYAWVTVGNPGAIIYVGAVPLHACFLGLAVAIPTMIIVSLLTKPEYEKAEATNYWKMGKEMMESDLVVDKQERPGLFGWLGADTVTWKVFWVIVFTVYGLHYLLAFFFHIYASAITMVWISFIVGVAMIFLLAIMGGADLAKMVRASKELEQQRLKS